MSILINGMEMPKNCADCPFGDAVCCNLMPGVPAWWAEYDQCVEEKRLHSHCPLVPVQPHGRLIDADALCDGLALYNPVVIYADCMPTIIPASEEGE